MTVREASVRAGIYEGEPVVFVGLTRGAVAVVDADEWPYTVRKHGSLWRAVSNGSGRTYAVRDVVDDEGNVRTLTLARAVAEAYEGSRVEPINGDSLDCRMSNLRLLNPKQARAKRQQFAAQQVTA